MKRFLNSWNYIRVLRLALGIMVFAQGISLNDWMLITTGTLFSLLPVLNLGCCSMGTCKRTRQIIENKKVIENPVYEKIK